jgi:cellulose synthase/poly-beta-1,6-N-acetylglucosamine synthase-like glycosyltransferase
VDQSLPSVTVVIAARPAQAEIKAIVSSRALDYPAEKLEIIVARGRQPSAQRNAALKAAHGDLIYFLDDDSVAEPVNLRRAVPHFAQPAVKMVGGPNVCPPDAPPLEQVFALVLASRLAFGPSSARYAAVGEARATSEKELILCNLVARREALLELGGFNEALYPNEENALMDELQAREGKLMYEPQCVVYRRPRPSLRAFAKMLMTYGRGRAEQFRLHPTFGSALNFVPPLFCAYLVVLAVALLAFSWLGKIMLAPLAIYAVAVVLQAAALLSVQSPKLNREESEPPLPEARHTSFSVRLVRTLGVIPLIFAAHVLYGLGVWRGLFTRLGPAAKRPPAEVKLEIIVPMDGAR